MANFLGEVVGKLVTIAGFDGSKLRNVAVDTNGKIMLADQEINMREYRDVFRYTGQQTASSGAINLSTPTVGAGELLVVSHMLAWIGTGSAALINIALWDAINNYLIMRDIPVAVNVAYMMTTPVILKAGEYLMATAATVGASTTFNAKAVGYFVRMP